MPHPVHQLDELRLFIDHLNSRVVTITFTDETSHDRVSFLDVTVKLVDGVLQTDLFSKPTDSHDYLLYHSAHPQRCKDIPYSQFLRIRRICSNLEDFELNVLHLAGHFQLRGYPQDLILEAAIQARRLDRDSLLLLKVNETRADDNRVFLITTYHPNDQTARNIARQNWDILGQRSLNRSTKRN